MTQVMSKACPDASQTQILGHVALGHALLRTTWESDTEQQPLSLDQQQWICGDIRLDQRAELCQQLQAKGRQTEPHIPDVNLVLAAYQVWGQDCLSHLSGDFAFVVWDAVQQTLFCARDHFGVVPCYYAHSGNKLIISNHLQPIQLHPQVSATLNDDAIADFLLFGMNRDLTKTTFTDIHKLPQSYQMCWQAGKLHQRRYWQMPEQVDYLRYAQPEQYIEQFKELFTRSVDDRLRTDKAASHLSGGMDSTSIAVTAHQLLQDTGKPYDFRTYCIQYNWLIQNEEHVYAAQVAEHSGFPVEYLMAEDYILQPPDMDWPHQYPEPLVIPNQLAEIAETQRTATFSRVLFAGFGGDPLLYPNPDYWRHLWQRRQWGYFWQEGIKPVMLGKRRPALGIRSGLYRALGKVPYSSKLPEWYQPTFAGKTDIISRWQHHIHRSPQRERYGMLTEPLWSHIFSASDPGYTGAPVKLRFPFFNQQLMLFMLRVPSYPWLEDKALLRAAMQGQLPDTVCIRPKTTLRQITGKYSREQQRRQMRWISALVKQPELAAYLNQTAVLAYLHEQTLSLQTIRPILPVLQLAYWFAKRSACRLA
jgi:asparagine synthase (glutamine-hydrolysing)